MRSVLKGLRGPLHSEILLPKSATSVVAPVSTITLLRGTIVKGTRDIHKKLYPGTSFINELFLLSIVGPEYYVPPQ